MEHHGVAEPVEELRLEIDKRSHADVARLGQTLINRFQYVEGERHHVFDVLCFDIPKHRPVDGTAGIATHIDIGRVDQIPLGILDAGITLLHRIIGIGVLRSGTIIETSVDTQFGCQPLGELETALHIEGEGIALVILDTVLVVFVVE